MSCVRVNDLVVCEGQRETLCRHRVPRDTVRETLAQSTVVQEGKAQQELHALTSLTCATATNYIYIEIPGTSVPVLT